MKSFTDLHQDLILYFTEPQLLNMKYEPFEKNAPGVRPLDIPALESIRAHLIVAAIFPFTLQNGRWIGTTTGDVLEQVKKYESIVQQFPIFHIVKSKKDLEKYGVGLLLHIEGLDFLSDLQDLEKLYAQGIRSLGITWNFKNQFAAGCNEKEGGLSSLGKILLQEARRIGFLVDLVHLNERSFLEASDALQKPYFVSHSAVRALGLHAQGATDRMLKEIRITKSIFGFGFLKSFYGATPSLETVTRHMTYAKTIIPASQLAFGTDYFGFSPHDAIRGLEHISGLNLLEQLLHQQGWSELETDQLFSASAKNFIQSQLP